ncbi:MAG TPA: NADH-quinone oxidoreductase subunit C [Acetobacteraceae bacterium]|nr:NADH-quinone oxidoreductase subunit C [Acetobacteraceae bacterium]
MIEITQDDIATLAALPGVTDVSVQIGETVIHAEATHIVSLMNILRDDPRFEFQQMMDVCGVDFPQRAARFDIVYQLLSVTRNARLRVIIQADETSSIASVSGIWRNAVWWEREIWDLFGVTFSGLADHRRIVTDYGFEGHPLRKDFPLTGYVEVHYDEDRKSVVYDKVELTQEFRNFDFLSPWEAMTNLPGDEKARRE